MNQFLKGTLMVCVSLFALTGQAMSDWLADAKRYSRLSNSFC